MPPFSLLQRRRLPAGSTVALSPSFDVMAWSSPSGGLAVARSIEFEKVIALQGTGGGGGGGGRAVAWRPDGKVLAVAKEGGDVFLMVLEQYGGERKQALPPMLAEKREIGCLVWTAKQVKRGMIASRELLPGIKKLPTFAALKYASSSAAAAAAGQQEGMDGTNTAIPATTTTTTTDEQESRMVDVSLFNSRECLDVLVIGQDSGVVSLKANGDFLVGCMRLDGCFSDVQNNTAHTCVTHVCLSPDFAHMLAILSHQQDNGGAVEYRAVIVDTSALSCNAHLLARVSADLGRVARDLNDATEALKMCVKIWEESIVGPLRKHFAPLSEMLSTTVVHDELSALLTTGAASVSLMTYLSSSCTDANLNRLERSLVAGCTSLSRLLTQHICVAMEDALFLIGDLVGLARANTLASVGLDDGLMTPMLILAETVVISARRVSMHVNETKSYLASFTKWTRGCSQRKYGEAGNQQQPVIGISPQDVANVKRLLHTGFFHREADLALEFGVENAGPIASSDDDARPSWDRSSSRRSVATAPSSAASPLGMMLGSNTLAKELEKFVDHFKTCIPRVSRVMNEQFAPLEVISLFRCEARADHLIAVSTFGLTVAFADVNRVVLRSFRQQQDVSLLQACECTFTFDEEIDALGFCEASPGKKSALGNETFVVVASSLQRRRFLTLLKVTRNEGPMLVETLSCWKHRELNSSSKKTVALKCSGPRGIVCVVSANAAFELLDVAHDDEEEDEDVVME